MTEWVWLRCTDPRLMLEHISGTATERRLRLFTVAVARLVWDDLPEGELRDAVEDAERHADGLADPRSLDGYRNRLCTYPLRGVAPDLRAWAEAPGNRWLFWLACATTYSGHELVAVPNNWGWWEAVSPVRRSVPRLLRDIFGNPFRPVSATSAWLTQTVLSLAEGVSEDQAFDRLPILADALEDAGCDNTELLTHLRSEGPHVRGCWALDILLGKE